MTFNLFQEFLKERKLFLCVTLTILILIINIIILFPQFFLVATIKVKYSKDKKPYAYIVPEDRGLISPHANNQQYIQVSSDDYKFEVPWSELISKDYEEEFQSFYFTDNKSIIIYKNRDEVTVTEGENTNNKVNYETYKRTLLTTPDQITLLLSYEEAKERAANLIEKALYTAYSSRIYLFRTKNIKGIQFGNPKDDRGILILFFGLDSKPYRVRLYLANQDEIDIILSSIQFIK